MGISQLPWLQDRESLVGSGEANPTTIFDPDESLRIRWLFKTLEDYLIKDEDALTYLHMLANIVLSKIR